MSLNYLVNSFDVPSVTVDEVTSETFLLDVRENDEWAAGHIDGATHIPMRELPAALARDPDQLPTGASIVVVCAVGGRSGQVTAWLNQQGIEASNLVGGMHAWAQALHTGQVQNSGEAMRAMVSDTGAPATVL